MDNQSFWWGTDVEDFWFRGFTVKSQQGLIGLCFLVGFMAFLFEYLRYLQTKQKQKELILRAKQIKLLCSTESAALLAQTVTNTRNPLNITLCDRAFLFGMEVSLWLFVQNLGYFLMLGVMVFNGWFLVSAVIGGGVGYFIFGQMFMKINIQNCHIMREAYCTQICGEIAANSSRNSQNTQKYDLV
ncbi:copper transporter 5.1-like isoform X2 [Anoplophora glabripennis]|uniref:copper transporter 5.1-like isoform X2 n=1 Tax=Anoplophora glabripennis TaxID=217634 RepID=UPI000873E86E|nr:copper transporter 5.1-like isoform X2 [Anoplophora glabripennis]